MFLIRSFSVSGHGELFSRGHDTAVSQLHIDGSGVFVSLYFFLDFLGGCTVCYIGNEQSHAPLYHLTYNTVVPQPRHVGGLR